MTTSSTCPMIRSTAQRTTALPWSWSRSFCRPMRRASPAASTTAAITHAPGRSRPEGFELGGLVPFVLGIERRATDRNGPNQRRLERRDPQRQERAPVVGDEVYRPVDVVQLAEQPITIGLLAAIEACRDLTAEARKR